MNTIQATTVATSTTTTAGTVLGVTTTPIEVRESGKRAEGVEKALNKNGGLLRRRRERRMRKQTKG